MALPPFIFAPGLMCDDRLFDPQKPFLGGTVADLSADDSIAGMAARLLKAAPERFILAGLSMGGIVGFEVVRQAPERVMGLALLNTSARADAPRQSEIRHTQIARVNQGALRQVVLEELKPNYLGEEARGDQDLLDLIYAMAEGFGPPVFKRQSTALMNRVDSRQSLLAIQCPTLIIAGEEDEVCPVKLHEEMAAPIPYADLIVLPECGHLSTLEQPAHVTKALASFAEKIAQAQ